MLKIGMLVDNRYKILREIGRGGTSCVYLAENIRLHNYWAIKEIYKSSTGDGVKSDMLLAESSILTKLRHPGMPSIIDILNTPQSYMIVMEYIEGVSLDKVLTQRGACSEKDVIRWGLQLCDVLSYLHSQQPAIIYRDMKPANVMLKPDGSIALIDFGIAREFKPSSLHDTVYLGTHGYAAPEQYNNKRQSDVRTDIYSLGITLYHLVTGRDPCLPPYGTYSICSVNPALSHELDEIIQKCTRIEPNQRYQNVNQLCSALKSLELSKTTQTEYEDEPRKKGGKWLWLLLIIPAAIIVVVIITLNKPTPKPDIYSYFNGISDYFSTPETDEVTLHFEQEVYIGESDERKYYTLVPQKTGMYAIYSVSYDVLPVIWLSDENDNLVDKNNTSGEYDDFYLECWLVEGETYYIETTLYDLNPDTLSTGLYWIYVDYLE